MKRDQGASMSRKYCPLIFSSFEQNWSFMPFWAHCSPGDGCLSVPPPVSSSLHSPRERGNRHERFLTTSFSKSPLGGALLQSALTSSALSPIERTIDCARTTNAVHALPGRGGVLSAITGSGEDKKKKPFSAARTQRHIHTDVAHISTP